MADNVAITPGSGATIAADDVGGVKYQRIKIDVGGDGVSKPVIQGGSDGLPVDILSVAGDVSTKPKSGEVWPINDNSSTISVDDGAGSLTIDAPVGTPVFVRLSDGSSAITTLPVSGSVTANQGTPVAVASGWPIKITDGTDTVGISSVSTARALKVNVIQSVSLAGQQDDLSSISKVVTVGGLYNESATDPSSGQIAAVRITQERALHISIRKADGTELGIAATPVRTDPTGTTIQPVSGTVTANLKDASNTAFSESNPLPVEISVGGRTRVTVSIAISASQTGATVWTPASGKKFIVEAGYLVVSVTGTLAIFDSTNAAANLLLNGTIPVGFFPLASKFKSATADNVLKYTSGTGMTAVLTLHGYEL